ncbi:hypothetical protein NDU88_006308 [Pleurodeles waltl]|uniref:Uncharacterized protein n=1 Tax=Pleurodeles waltl TaxID=8319 RepID=A0AAV7L5G8_PLEWA|nr:hypothetical protein NDU88_006308 [Pleurodeles waltl]
MRALSPAEQWVHDLWDAGASIVWKLSAGASPRSAWEEPRMVTAALPGWLWAQHGATDAAADSSHTSLAWRKRTLTSTGVPLGGCSGRHSPLPAARHRAAPARSLGARPPTGEGHFSTANHRLRQHLSQRSANEQRRNVSSAY